MDLTVRTWFRLNRAALKRVWRYGFRRGRWLFLAGDICDWIVCPRCGNQMVDWEITTCEACGEPCPPRSADGDDEWDYSDELLPEGWKFGQGWW